MQIALFGGTFDPPHRGHQYIAQQLIKQHKADAVWFVPVKNHPFHRPMSPAEHRLAMLKEVVTELRRELVSFATKKNISVDDIIRIETYELHHSSISYSYDTLEALSVQYPEHTFSWVIGSDNLESFHKWHKFQEILKKFSVLVYPRKNFSPQPLYTGMQFLEGFPEVTISATEVRQKVADEQDVKTDVLPKVAEYIQTHQLYKARV